MRAPVFLLSCEDTLRDGQLLNQEPALSRRWICLFLVFGLLGLRKCEEVFSFFLSFFLLSGHPVYGVFLQQPEVLSQALWREGAHSCVLPSVQAVTEVPSILSGPLPSPIKHALFTSTWPLQMWFCLPPVSVCYFKFWNLFKRSFLSVLFIFNFFPLNMTAKCS